MSGKIKNCEGPFHVYHLYNDGYIGISSRLNGRIKEHKSQGKDGSYKILKTFNNVNDALDYEYDMQVKYGYPTSNIRNQYGLNNPNCNKWICLDTGKVLNGLKEAANYLNISYDCVRRKEYKEKYNLIKYID